MRLGAILLIFFILSCGKQPAILSPPDPVHRQDWFTINTEDDYSPSELDANDWLDAPAGKYGWVKQVDDHFEFDNGQIIKFWGANLAGSRVFMSHEEAESFAEYFQKYGLNAIRLHKFTWDLVEGQPKSTVANNVLFEKKDYLIHQLREKGIYYGWSHIYGHRVAPGDSAKLLAYEEVKNVGFRHLKGTTYNLVYFAKDLQDLSIDLTVNMLNHVNPYTGIRYADDPALCFIEFNNEDNLFFASAHERILNAPTYKKLIERMFSDWLSLKYKTHQGLIDEWGEEALNAFPQAQSNEHLDSGNIYPMANHVILSTDFINNNRHLKRRIWDTALFLYETQNAYYQKFHEAVRATGYKGPIVPSGWQAGDNIAHLYNLHSDYLFGFIDRHNYYGGERAGPTAMLDAPGLGLLSSGLQQVIDRPFALSEWISLMPNEWMTEDAPLIAIYGMGLQGWDASYAYATNTPFITNSLESPNHGVYNADKPTHMGLYPALSRMVLRGDIKEGQVISQRNVHVPGLADGKIGFEEKINQIYDVKEFTGTVPREALAVGRTVITFTDQFKETEEPDLSEYWNKQQKVIRSTTGQLSWSYAERGFVKVNTAGTVGFIGFAPDSTFGVGEYSFLTTNDFAVVFFTAMGKNQSLMDAEKILISAFARAENTGMIISEDKRKYEEQGIPPVLMEPVNFSVSFPHPKDYTLYILDTQGRKTGEEILSMEGSFNINSAKYKTMYYLLERN